MTAHRQTAICLAAFFLAGLHVSIAAAQRPGEQPWRQQPSGYAGTHQPSRIEDRSVRPAFGADNSAVRQASATQPATQRRERQPLAFGARRDETPSLSPSSEPRGTGRAATTIVGSLAVVVGLFFLVVWVSRKAAPAGAAPLPSEVVESLGRAPLSLRQQMQLVRVGRKLLLLSVTPTGAETLTEITDATEVDRLSGLCRQRQPGSMTETFRQVLASAGDSEASPNS